MVYLNRIYTRSGDEGETGLGTGERIPKTHPRIVAYGSVDELNSVLGLALTSPLPDDIAKRLRDVQNDLFDVGADLCMPERDEIAPDAEANQAPLRVVAHQVERLEHWIDAATADLAPLHSFVLPGGSAAAAHLHLARTVCRRVEIQVLRLADIEPINPQVRRYLNRLSDLLFVWARQANDHGRSDVLWVPGQNREAP
ncbi:MAG TPA: cob(I)yrinic acid a,c-diamide adenosyltransferase [Planctomycetaceae bacterium]|nr:cob(I)yrinic acid a,c-diamide adenosyltransferase [Planctomycetaceae bacterium]